MARARLIKPGFYKNEQLAECSLLARFIFPGLWMLADRRGRLEDRPKRMKADLLPYDAADVDTLLDELAAAGLLVRYSVDVVRLVQIVSFEKHQKCHAREVDSALPAQPERCLDDDGCLEKHNLGTPKSVAGTALAMVSPAEAEALTPNPNTEAEAENPTRAAPASVRADVWAKWLRYKGKQKTDTVALQARHLDEWSAEGKDPNAIIEESIRNGWKGLFAGKGPPPRRAGSTLSAVGQRTADNLSEWLNGTDGP
jgi:hypothetical protein